MTESNRPPGPCLQALLDSFPGMRDDEAALGAMAALDRTGATIADVEYAFRALDQAPRVRSEFDYWRVVLTKRVSRDWEELRQLRSPS